MKHISNRAESRPSFIDEKKPTLPRVCKSCGKDFMSITNKAQYCSRTCGKPIAPIKNDTDKQITELKRIVLDKGISISRLSDLCCWSSDKVSRVINHPRKTSIRDVIHVCDALKCDITDVL